MGNYTPRRSLSEIISQEESRRLDAMFQHFDNVAPDKDDADLLPRGKYNARVISGKLEHAKTGTLGYTLVFEIIEGPHASRRVWHRMWLTEAAQAGTMRALRRLNITSREQLMRPIPEGIVCELVVVIRSDDDGIEYNDVRRFTVIRVEQPTKDPFSPVDDVEADGVNDSEPADVSDDGDTSFDPARLNAELAAGASPEIQEGGPTL